LINCHYRYSTQKWFYLTLFKITFGKNFKIKDSNKKRNNKNHQVKRLT
jgi:hypothetical protein